MTLSCEDPIYAMGRSEGERRRLVEQAALYAASTRLLLTEAGLRPGWRVVDAGCGVGDVTLLAASLIGPDGTVVGVDTDAEALAVAEGRAAHAGLADHVRFVHGDLRDVSFDDGFDAVVGRFVLMYLRDPVEGVRRLARHVRPYSEPGTSGYERNRPSNWNSWKATMPPGRTVEWVVEAFRGAGVETNMGFRLPATFRDAGLPWPQAFVHTPLAGGPDHPAYSLFAHVLESLLPLIEGLGVSTRDEIGIDTYVHRLATEAVAHHAAGSAAPVVGAWSTVLAG